jgi:hypothetical protein
VPCNDRNGCSSDFFQFFWSIDHAAPTIATHVYSFNWATISKLITPLADLPGGTWRTEERPFPETAHQVFSRSRCATFIAFHGAKLHKFSVVRNISFLPYFGVYQVQPPAEAQMARRGFLCLMS